MSGILVPKPMLGRQLRKGHPLARGLIGYWLFNEGSGNKVFDLSGNGNTGLIYFDTHFVPGKFGSCLDFDGTDDRMDIVSTNGFGIKADSSMAVSFWFNARELPAGDIGLLSDHINNYNIRIRYDSNVSRWEIFTDRGGIKVLIFDWVMGLSQWYHIVVTNTDTALTLYIDGIYKGTEAYGSANLTAVGSNTIIIGGSEGVKWNGQIDLPMIYNRALNASEIAELYWKPFGMFDRMPIELWVGATSVGAPPPTGNPWNYYAQSA